MNCAFNERSVFSKPEFNKLFQQYHLIKFYTDEIPVEFYAPALRETVADDDRRQHDAKEINFVFQSKAFNNNQLPLYVILEPLADGAVKIVGTYDEGKINNESAFAKFLSDPLSPTAN